MSTNFSTFLLIFLNIHFRVAEKLILMGKVRVNEEIVKEKKYVVSVSDNDYNF